MNAFAQTNIPPLVIIDFRVQLWRIIPHVQTLHSLGASNEDIETYVKACWAILFNRGPDALPNTDYTVVVVDDNGASGKHPYWRAGALASYFGEVARALIKEGSEPGEPYAGYKAGRAAKPDDFNLIAQIGLGYIKKQKLPYFTKPAYEADDWAGYAVYLRNNDLNFGRDSNLANREVFLYTVDTDWLQLAGRGVYWCNTGPWTPRVRGEEEACAYLVKKARVKTLRLMGAVKYATQIVDWKVLEGDKADNLPAGTPRWAIDLIGQHPKHGLAYQPGAGKYQRIINSVSIHTNRDHVKQSFDWIASRGFPLLFPYDPVIDYSWKSR